MKLLKGLLIAVTVLVAGVLGVGLLLPDTAHVERAIVIQARPATVYTALNGFRQFNKWSPWASLDPGTHYVFEGPATGVGAKFRWRSDDPGVGSGSQEILEAVPYERIAVKLVFEGSDSDNLATYTLAAEGEGTRLVWSYDTVFHGNILGRYFGLMLDGMIGPDYERGLARLKTLVEGLPQTDIATLDVETLMVEPRPMLYVAAVAGPDDAEAVLDGAYARLRAYLAAYGRQAVAAPIAITRGYDVETKHWRFDAAVILDRPDDIPPAPEQGIQAGTTYAGLVLRAVHTGPAATIESTYDQLAAWRTVAGFEDNGDVWEQYVSDPATTPAAQRITHIYWPVR